MQWQPTASIETLKQRAAILRQLRDFFAAREVLEVETPCLAKHAVTDPYIESIPANALQQTHYLQTSPEYAMKRLLAAGSGSIYQICKAFRQDQVGRLHNPEFTMLEWYRIGFDHHQLMQEVDELLQLVLGRQPAVKISYHDVFQEHLGISPHTMTVDELKQCALKQRISFTGELDSTADWLQLLFSHCIEPKLGFDSPTMIYDFPSNQAALAKIKNDEFNTASRFELYIDGIEIANGFHELQDAKEQEKRFKNNLETRQKLKLPQLKLDQRFLAALEHGLPDCAGVALGLDRLLMIITKNQRISKTLSFSIENA